MYSIISLLHFVKYYLRIFCKFPPSLNPLLSKTYGVTNKNTNIFTNNLSLLNRFKRPFTIPAFMVSDRFSGVGYISIRAPAVLIRAAYYSPPHDRLAGIVRLRSFPFFLYTGPITKSKVRQIIKKSVSHYYSSGKSSRNPPPLGLRLLRLSFRSIAAAAGLTSSFPFRAYACL